MARRAGTEERGPRRTARREAAARSRSGGASASRRGHSGHSPRRGPCLAGCALLLFEIAALEGIGLAAEFFARLS